MSKRSLASFAAGLIFGAGLLISGMTRTDKVIGFLDLSGDWDPALMFVMVGAIGINALAYRVMAGWSKPLLDDRWHVPTKTVIDRRLVFGAGIFGVGWGISGFCPGPAVVASAGGGSTLVFVAAVLAGMLLHAGYARVARAYNVKGSPLTNAPGTRTDRVERCS